MQPSDQQRVEAIFFDAAGTLFGLRQSVGDTYARVAAEHGVSATPAALNAGFRKAWNTVPPPHGEGSSSSPDDERGWWKNLVAKTFASALEKPLETTVLAPLFDDLFSCFADPAVWQVFDDVPGALDVLQRNFSLHVISNFDRRLYGLLAGLDIGHFFHTVTISSEVGSSKPHPRIFLTALGKSCFAPERCLHVGDDRECDAEGAASVGMQSFLVDRPRVTLSDLVQKLSSEQN